MQPLALRGWGRNKPPVGYGINRLHPLGANLYTLYLLNECGGSSIYDICNKNVGAFSNAPTWVPSAVGPAINFVAGSSQSIILPGTSVVSSTAGTIAVLFRSGATAGNIYNEGSTSFSANTNIELTSGKLQARQRTNSSVSVQALSTATYNDNQWHFAYCVRQAAGSPILLYVDGKLAGTGGNTGSPYSVNAINIGAQEVAGTFTNYLTGQVAAVWTWKVILSAAQIAAHFADPFGMVLRAPVPRVMNSVGGLMQSVGMLGGFRSMPGGISG